MSRSFPLLLATFHLTFALALLLAPSLSGQEGPGASSLSITEFMASNTRTLADENGEFPDWIEIHNAGSTPVSLLNWCLSDDASQLAKWRFPATNLAANAYLVIFASEKDRHIPGAPLHTNFKLGAGGEFLALTAPDGVTIVSSFAPVYPPQAPDISFGLGRVAVESVLVETGAVGRVWVPADDSLGLGWTDPLFDASSWSNAVTGIGFQAVTSTNNFRPFIQTDLQTRLYRTNTSVYLRLPFFVADPGAIDHLNLQLKFDDGYVAYLNGVEISSDRAPDLLNWQSASTEDRPDVAALSSVNVPLDEWRGLLRAGTNLLAFQGLNSSNANPNFLLLPRLVAARDLTPTNVLRYFTAPTPGLANGFGTPDLGPILGDPTQSPDPPRDQDDLSVSIRVTPSFAPAAAVILHYRVMYSNEVTVPMLDDGLHADGLAGDGVYGGVIPAAAANPGQMMRWYVTASDTGGRTSRWPAFSSPLNSPQYEGTVVQTRTATSLPLLQWFVESPSLAASDAGTRCSIYYLGEFYDNVFTSLRGQASRGYPKKSFKLDFNTGYHFRFDPALDRVEEINLMTTSADKSFLRTTMAYESFRDVGCPWMISFPIRVDQNGTFNSVSVLSEHPDETWLKRNGLDPNGAFYKMFNSLESVNGADKRTRLFEDSRDLQELVNNVFVGSTNRVRWLYDNVDLAAMVNYLAVMIVIHDNDAPHKNYWMYRDTEGTREWRMLPWDKDLSFGLVFNGGLSDDLYSNNDGSGIVSPSHPFFADQRHQKIDLQWNRLVEAMYITPPILEMFKRRLRTVMDQLLQPPGTWPTLLKYERRMDEAYQLMKDDVALDRARWPYFYGAPMDFVTGLQALKQGYLAPRRLHLYQTHSIHNPGYAKSALLPDPQPADTTILFGSADPNPASGRQEEEYIQLLNTNSFAAEISGWHLGGSVQHTFEPGTVIPSNGVLYVSPNVAAFRARTAGPRGGQTNFAQGNYHGHLSARGGTLELTDDHQRRVATLNYPGQPSLAQQFLRITELMYHPSAPAPGSPYLDEDFEYIELRNLGPTSLNLTGVRFTAGIDFDFTASAVTQLESGQRVLVVRNAAAFASRYGTLPIAGQYLGSFDNAGETIRLVDAVGEVILEFSYDNHWYPITDGFGFSLVITEEEADWSAWNQASSWRPSGQWLGSPGADDPLPPGADVIRINEVLSASTFPVRDAVELRNFSPTPISVDGWWLTDDFRTPKKYRLPAGTVVPGNGFLVLDEAQFNPTPGVSPSFAFSSAGDEVYLFAADAAGNLTGYYDGFAFGAAEAGVSWGRLTTSDGETHVVSLGDLTLGAPNSGPRLGPIHFSEIFYHPVDLPDGGDDVTLEFVELRNNTTVAQPLFDPLFPTNTWRVRGGIDFDFPTNLTLSPGGVVVLVSFDPDQDPAALAAFQQRLQLPLQVSFLGPFSGKLQNSSDRLELQKPGAPVEGLVPYVLVDAVRYRDEPPWPAQADGLGLSLQRRLPLTYGDDPLAWYAAAPSPGRVPPLLSELPALTLLPSDQTVLAPHPATFQVQAAGTAPLHYQWRHEGQPLPGATSSALQLINIGPEQAGLYDVVVYNDAGHVTSPGVHLNVQLPPVIAGQPVGKPLLVGTDYTLSIQAFGTGPLRYQWLLQGVPLLGATNSSLIFTNAQESQSGTYYVSVTDAIASVLSDPAEIHFLTPPSISMNPPPQTLTVAGDTVTLLVSANGSFPLSYRWRRNGVILTNQVLSSHLSAFTLSNVQPSNGGIYSVSVTNLAPSTAAQSAGSTLIVQADVDGDHIADVWEVFYGFPTNNSAEATLDSDGDGVSNLDEFRAGTDPRDPQSFLRVDRVGVAGPAALVEFGARSNKTYAVQFSELQDLLAWQTLTNLPSRTTNWRAAIFDPSPLSSRRFYRVATPWQP